MRLSEESIKDILDLQKNMLPLIYCCSSKERLTTLSRGIVYYNGKLGYKLNASDSKSRIINTLLIFLDEISEDNILDIEKKLISLNKDEVVLLEATGIDLLKDKRNLAVSFINRYNINIIKGTKEEIDTLIKFQNDEENDEDTNFKYRTFSKKNHSVLIVKGDYYYITDGYSEFSIKNRNNEFEDIDYLENIYTGMLAVGIGVCKSKSEIVKSIIISTIAFYMAQTSALNLDKNELDDNKYEKSFNEMNECLLNEIYKIDVDKIRAYGDINYSFKR